MNYHLIVTDNCNLCCSYCRGRIGEGDDGTAVAASYDEDMPNNLECDLEALTQFLLEDPEPSVTFYGGEPLLRPDLIEEIMTRASTVRYLLHTNGTLLHLLPRSLFPSIETISVSLDGPEELTDHYRGKGTYRKVMDNIQSLQETGFTGELIARMTISEQTCIETAVKYLSSNPDHSFSSIHWQLDADFCGEGTWKNFRSWVQKSYNPGVRTLIGYWIDEMKSTGKVHRWYPFIDPLQDLLLKRKSLLRCGCGHASYGILTNGALVPCPLMIGMKEYYVGRIGLTHPGEIPVCTVDGYCSGCTIRDFCGGRCLFSNIMQLWSTEQRRLLCGTVWNLYDCLTEVLPEVQSLLKRGVIRLSDFDHPRFNGCEIIP